MIKSLKRLEFLLGYKISLLKNVAQNVEDYYYKKEILKTNEDGSPRLKNGEKVYRILYPSNGTLKEIQKQIQRVILTKIEFSENIQGGIKGKSNITNSRFHQGNKYFFNTDLSSYYPSVSYNLVYEALLSFDFSYDVSSLLTKLTTYKYSLPQGTHTSPYLANLVFNKYDKELIKLTNEFSLKYTRFVDDISVSGSYDFQNKIPEITNVIFLSPFDLNHRKTFYKIGPTVVTGVITKNNELSPRDDQITKYENWDLSGKQKKGMEEYFRQIEESNS